MDGRTIGFIGWGIMGGIVICLGIYTYFAKNPMRFWANAKLFEVSDVKKYNHAVSKLFCIFGIVIVALGTPLLSEQNAPLILISSVGLMIASVITMAVYSLVIEKKYRKGTS